MTLNRASLDGYESSSHQELALRVLRFSFMGLQLPQAFSSDRSKADMPLAALRVGSIMYGFSMKARAATLSTTTFSNA
ncbi:hypothetical protein WK53_02955 [Burkholderia ubonensis]|uniref:Uncharacterized protein n=1 Tax=Burkholderia ubonensis TaxID=101571 RepID=A0AAW3NK28_9BURK|nr:hypothetical protein WK53_02955 [Burkholderia ubonensis]